MNASAVPPSRILLGALAVTLLCGIVLLATSPILPMTWDEGNAIGRAEKIPGEWIYTTQLAGHPHVEGHPAFYGIVIRAGQWLTSVLLPPLESARFGPMLLFAIAAGAMFYRMARDYSTAAGIAATAALVLTPRMFAHAHFASIDGPLVSCWILAWVTFVSAVGDDGRPPVARWLATIAFGITLGMTLSCKATGWIAPVPFVVWAVLYRDRSAAKVLAVGIPVALLAFFAFNPPLWEDPIARWNNFFYLNFNRADNPGLNISILFLGEMYNLEYSLPWYNTLFWTAVTVPIAILALAIVGIVRSIGWCRTDRLAVLILANWLVLIVVRALPSTPPHDGVRLFLPAFAFLAALAGVGCSVLLQRRRPAKEVTETEEPEEASPLGEGEAAETASDRADSDKPSEAPAEPGGNRTLTVVLLALLFLITTANLFVFAPQWLSYYNIAIGSLPGATHLGMEPTYYWDGFDRSVLDWLHENTAEDERILLAASSPQNFVLLEKWNVLRRRWYVPPPFRRHPNAAHYRWYVLQHRPSGCYPADVWLIENAQPAHRRQILGVAIVDVYSIDDYQRAWSAIEEQAIAETD